MTRASNEAKSAPAYRLTQKFAFYDDRRSHLWREFSAGSLITDPAEIALLMARGAALEKIET